MVIDFLYSISHVPHLVSRIVTLIIPYDNYVIYPCTYVPFVSPFEETSHGYVVTTTFYRTCPRRHLDRDYHHGQCPTGTSATSMQLEYRRYRRVQYAPAASAQPRYRTR
jgi:hypothetical protein